MIFESMAILMLLNLLIHEQTFHSIYLDFFHFFKCSLVLKYKFYTIFIKFTSQ